MHSVHCSTHHSFHHSFDLASNLSFTHTLHHSFIRLITHPVANAAPAQQQDPQQMSGDHDRSLQETGSLKLHQTGNLHGLVTNLGEEEAVTLEHAMLS